MTVLLAAQKTSAPARPRWGTPLEPSDCGRNTALSSATGGAVETGTGATAEALVGVPLEDGAGLGPNGADLAAMAVPAAGRRRPDTDGVGEAVATAAAAAAVAAAAAPPSLLPAVPPPPLGDGGPRPGPAPGLTEPAPIPGAATPARATTAAAAEAAAAVATLLAGVAALPWPEATFAATLAAPAPPRAADPLPTGTRMAGEEAECARCTPPLRLPDNEGGGGGGKWDDCRGLGGGAAVHTDAVAHLLTRWRASALQGLEHPGDATGDEPLLGAAWPKLAAAAAAAAAADRTRGGIPEPVELPLMPPALLAVVLPNAQEVDIEDASSLLQTLDWPVLTPCGPMANEKSPAGDSVHSTGRCGGTTNGTVATNEATGGPSPSSQTVIAGRKGLEGDERCRDDTGGSHTSGVDAPRVDGEDGGVIEAITAPDEGRPTGPLLIPSSRQWCTTCGGPFGVPALRAPATTR